MSQGLNRVTLFGNLGADPELRKLPSGTSLLKMRLATNYSFLNKDGTREERVDWHSVLVWGARGEGLARYLAKGSSLIIEGQIRTNSYEKDGEKRYSTEIHADNVLFAGRRGPDVERVPDELEPLPFGLASADVGADMRDSGGRYEGPGRRGDSDIGEPVHPDREPPDDEGRSDGAMEEMPRFPPPRDQSGGAVPPPPPPPRRKIRSPAGAPAMVSV